MKTEENFQNLQETFNSVQITEKNQLYLIMKDKYVQLLFSELSDILTKDEFFTFLQSKNRIKLNEISAFNQEINLNRTDELILNQNNSNNGKNYTIFDHRLKNKFLKYDDNLNLLHENFKKNDNKTKFWEEYIDNQKKKEAELIGEFNPPFLSQDQQNKISEIKKKTPKLMQEKEELMNDLNFKMSLSIINI